MIERASSPRLWSGLSTDLRFALRQLRKRALFSAACIAVLALGLGANTAIFAVLYAAVLEPLPFPHPNQLVAVHNRFPLLNLPRLNAAPLDYLDLRQHHELFADAGGYYYLDLNRTGIAVPVKVNAIAATTSLFTTLGVNPILGRLFNDAEQRYHGPHAVILSEQYWRTAFGSDPKILTRSLLLDGDLYPIIGVMPGWFQVPNEVTQMWTPLTFSPRELMPAARRNHNGVFMYARVATGLTFAEAAARLQQLSHRLSLQDPQDYPLKRLGWSFFLQPLAKDNDGSERSWLATLFAAVSGLLLIVAVNIAGLLVVRSTERQFEVSVRMALGATRFRIARQVISEVLAIAFLGGMAALFVAQNALRILEQYKPLPGVEPQLAGPVLLFGSLLCLVTGLACSVFPAWTASLNEAGHQRTASRDKIRLRQGFIIGQVALATTLLLCGGLLIRSLLRLIETPPGFDPHHVLTLQVSLPPNSYTSSDQRLHFYATVLDRLHRAPGLEAASGCTLLPFGWGDMADTFEIVGRPKPSIEPYTNINVVFPDYFSTLHISLLRGRHFNDDDRNSTTGQGVAIIDQTMAQRYFGNQDPIGQFIHLPSQKPHRIIGVVSSVKNSSLDLESRPILYYDAEQWAPLDVTLIVRSSLRTAAIESAVRHSVNQVDKDQPIYDVIPLETFIAKSFRTRRFVVCLITLFAALGTLLAALGLYALLSYNILLRRREFAIRMAVGANRQDIGSLVLRAGMLPVGLGIAMGCAGALALRRVLSSQLYATCLWDIPAWSAVLLTIVLACALACALPTWRASRLDPSIALRDE